MAPPRVSVIIPSYNARKYIGEALESVAAQSFTDYEVIVIDDGSTDGTGAFVAERYPDVRYRRVPNGGASRARNLGVEEARGALVAFLDADDLWLPTKLEKQVRRFEEDHALAMVFTESVVFAGEELRPNPYSKRERLMQGDLVRNIFLYSYVGTPTVMVRKDVFEQVGGFLEGLQVAEDDNLWMRIALRFQVDLIDEVLVRVRYREGSLTATPGALFQGINEHVEIIKNEFPELRARIGSFAIRRKVAMNYFMRGYSLFSDGDMRHSRRYFARSFMRIPRPRILLYLVGTLLPTGGLESLRRLKRSVRQ